MLSLLLAGCGDKTAESKQPDRQETITEQEASDTRELPADQQPSADRQPAAQPDIDVDVTEKMYVAYINEIYVNTDDYVGKMIRIEGLFQAYTDENTGKTYYYVYRTGPGCCGNDGSMCGFEFTWEGDMPKDNNWIEVIGKLRSYEEDGWTYLTLDAASVEVMDVRGAETVYQ